ncbi:MAG: hypothetical protein U1F87_11150 [Kiritimatiellia bacterium]
MPSIHQAKANSLLQNGSQIARTFLATHITEDQRENLNPTSTSTNAFTTSTDYFKHLIKEQGIFVGTDFSAFSAVRGPRSQKVRILAIQRHKQRLERRGGHANIGT